MIDIYYYFFANYKIFFPNIVEVINIINLSIILFLFYCSGKIFLRNSIFNNIEIIIGWFFFYCIIFLSNFIFRINLFNSILIYFFIIFLYIFFYKKVIFFEFKSSLLLIIIYLPFLFFLVSMKTIEWDSFAFWNRHVQYMIDYKSFVKGDLGSLPHHIAYPQAKNLIVYASSIFSNSFPENIPSILSFVMLINIVFIIFKSFHKEISHYYLIATFVFCSPIIMNSKTFSSYHDLSVGILLLSSVYCIRQINLSNGLKNFDFKSIFICGFVFSLLTIVKNTGVIHLFSILICLFFLIIKNNSLNFLFNYKIFIKFLTLTLVSILPLLLWYLSLHLNKIYFNEIESFGSHGFRFEIIPTILKSMSFQIMDRKFIFFSCFFSFLYSFYVILKNKFKCDSIYYYIFFIILIWFVFLFYNYLTNFNLSAAERASSFWRYVSQLTPLILYFLYFVISKNKIFLKLIKNYSKNIIIICKIILLITPFVFSYKIRRDLLPPYLDIRNLSKINLIEFKKDDKLLIFSDYPSFVHEISSYYLNIDKKNIVSINHKTKYQEVNYKYKVFIDHSDKLINRSNYIIFENAKYLF